LFFSSQERQRKKTSRHWRKGPNGGRRRVAGREGRRGECQTGLGFVWHETGALRNARPSRGQAASTRSRRKCRKRRRSLPFELTDGCYRWEVSTQEALTVILNAVPVAFSTDRQSADGPIPVAHGVGIPSLPSTSAPNHFGPIRRCILASPFPTVA